MPLLPVRERFTDLNRLSLSINLGSYTATNMHWGYIPPSWWRNYLHSHSVWEVCYAFSGRGTFFIRNLTYEVRAGDVFVAKPVDAHEIISSRDDPLGIFFWSYSLSRSREHRLDADALDGLIAAFTVSGCAVSSRVPSMEATIDLLHEEIVQHEGGYAHVIEGLVLKLLVDTCRAIVDQHMASDQLPAPEKSPTEQIVDRILIYLQDNYDHALSIRDVAAHVHLSERHTNRLFRATTGVSTAEYLTTLRLETASRLLLDGKLSIKEIARRTGYAEVHYFTTLFHRRIGITPGAFRRQHGTQRFGAK